MPKVSTIIPVYNRSTMIRDAVKSVLEQTYRPIEIVLVDDGSTDNTPQTLTQLQQQHPEIIKLVRQDNAGPGAARNAGLKLATGEFIQYLDSDDLLHPDKFTQQVAALRANPDAGVCYCITLRADSQTGDMVPWAETAERIDNIFPSFLPKRGWATLTPLWRRSVCDRIGPWMPFRVMEDWEHDLRAGMLGIEPVHVPESLCTVRDHNENRASGMNSGFTQALIRDFFLAHESVWFHMREHEFTDWNYLQRFNRTMFWIARMCGRHSLIAEAECALDYTDQMTAAHNLPNVTANFRRMKTVLGWRIAVGLGESLASWKSGRVASLLDRRRDIKSTHCVATSASSKCRPYLRNS